MDYPQDASVGLVDGKFVDENEVTAQVGSLIPSSWANSLTDEMLAVIKAAGITPDEATLTQLLTALKKLFANLAGASTQAFSVAAATQDEHAVRLSQMRAVAMSKFVSKAASYAVTASDAGTMFYCSVALTYTLPSAADCTGMAFGFQNNAGYTPTLATVSSQKIICENFSATSLALSKAKSQIVIVSDGNNWIAISASPFIQIPQVAPVFSSSSQALGQSGTWTQTVTFTAPSNGNVLARGALNIGSAPASTIGCTLAINGTSVSADSTFSAQSHDGTLYVTQGTAVTVTLTVATGSTSPAIQATLRVGASFIPRN